MIRILIIFIISLGGLKASAASLIVEPRSAGLDEAVTITVTLDGDLARVDAVDLPLTNLTIETGPSVSSQFEWSNGVTSRQKIFRWTAYGNAPGRATAGPLNLESRGSSAVLPAVTVEILPDPIAGAASPEEVVRRLLAADRELVFLFPEIDRTDVFVGEQVVITWYLYTAESIRDFDISTPPSLREFWTEEIPLTNERTREVRLAGVSMQRIPVRRVALFPLQTGQLNGGKLVAVAEVMRPIRDIFGMLSRIERRAGRIVLRAPAPGLTVHPLPEGVESDAVGQFSMTCSETRVPDEGPVSFEVTLQGEGNLRSARQPQFTTDPDARVEVQAGAVTVERTGARVRMSRTWTFILFPRKGGRMPIPAIAFRAWNPENERIETLRCPAGDVTARTSFSESPLPSEEIEPTDVPSGWKRAIAVGVVLLIVLLIATVLLRKRRKQGLDLAAALMEHGENPAAMRAALHDLLTSRSLNEEVLLRDSSDLGETYRSLRSLLDIRERETLTADRSQDELKRRVREFTRELEGVARSKEV